MLNMVSMFMKKGIVLLQMQPVQVVTLIQMENLTECQVMGRITLEICRTSSLMQMEMRSIQQKLVVSPLMLINTELLEGLLSFIVIQMTISLSQLVTLDQELPVVSLSKDFVYS